MKSKKIQAYSGNPKAFPKLAHPLLSSLNYIFVKSTRFYNALKYSAIKMILQEYIIVLFFTFSYMRFIKGFLFKNNSIKAFDITNLILTDTCKTVLHMICNTVN